jgi:hypothetical protein
VIRGKHVLGIRSVQRDVIDWDIRMFRIHALRDTFVFECRKRIEHVFIVHDVERVTRCRDVLFFLRLRRNRVRALDCDRNGFDDVGFDADDDIGFVGKGVRRRV